ncbi:MAG1 [[Candida] subhashii]|uniref:MAG1 n=1 Tax=[Candida] subhashii TaxID=561895 RepID=A0A8J5V4R4_9ASCO|nr:MAG1 [[Candida] subhashii]KAG7665284.1 MAG1 [[Candida] subhashii]
MVAITRSKKTTTATTAKKLRAGVTEHETIQVVQSKISKNVTSKRQPTTKKLSKVTKTKSSLEDLLAHVEIPKDLSLPQPFIDYHTSDFIDGLQHVLKIDPTLYPAVIHKTFPRFAKDRTDGDKEVDTIHRYWFALISSVISQQVSGHAAQAISQRFRELFKDEDPTPGKTLQLSPEELRGAGLSNQKVNYVISISQAFNNPNCPLTHLDFYTKSSLDEIIKELVKLKGIGIWSAKIPEVLQTVKSECIDDEEIQVMLKKKAKFAKNDSKRNWVPVHDEYVKFAAKRFAPYRSVFMLVLWRLGSTNIEILENLNE